MTFRNDAFMRCLGEVQDHAAWAKRNAERLGDLDRRAMRLELSGTDPDLTYAWYRRRADWRTFTGPLVIAGVASRGRGAQ